jgi:hypothetical protein
LQDGTRVNTAAIPAQPIDSDLAYYGHHPNLKWAHSAKTIHHGPAQRRSLQRRQPVRQFINMHIKTLVGPATPRRWRQPAKRSMPATRQARAHAQWHGNNTRPTRLGCTPRRSLHPQRHSLRPPGRSNNALCHSLQRRQPARQRPPTDTVLHWSTQRHPGGGDNRPGGARPQYAELGHTPRSTAITQDLRDFDARPSGTCIRGATAYVHRVCPETLSVTHCSRDNRPGGRQSVPCATRIHAPAVPVPTAPDHSARAGPATLTTVGTGPAQETIDTANHRPAQQRPCGRDNRPGELYLSKSTPPLCSPLCRYGPNNSAVDNIQTSRSSNGVHELFTIFGSHPPSSRKWGQWSQNGMDESHRIVEPHQQ